MHTFVINITLLTLYQSGKSRPSKDHLHGLRQIHSDSKVNKMLKNKKPNRCDLLYLLYFLDTQHVSGINMSVFRSLRLCC